MQMQYPAELVEDIRAILKFDEGSCAKLSEALDSVDAIADTSVFFTSASNKLKESPAVSNALRAITYIAFDRSKSFCHLSHSEYLDQLEHTLFGDVRDIDSARFTLIMDLLASVLNGENKLGVSIKANSLLVQNERNFLSAKIVSDIRSIFRDDEIGESPIAAIITHTLKVEYSHEGENSAVFIGLDENELSELRRVIERAEEKSSALRGQIEKSGIAYIKVSPMDSI